MGFNGKYQKLINDFNRKYCNLLRFNGKDSIKLWHFAGPGRKKHMLHEWKKMSICFNLFEEGIPFFTEFNLANKLLRPDIVCFPTDKRIVFIEVRNTETPETSEAKENKFRKVFPDADEVEFLFHDSAVHFDVTKIM